MVITIVNCDLELNPQTSGNDEAQSYNGRSMFQFLGALVFKEP